MDFQNTGSSNNSKVYDNTRTLIIAISVPGFVMMVILIILSKLCFIIKINGITLRSKDSMANSNECRY